MDNITTYKDMNGNSIVLELQEYDSFNIYSVLSGHTDFVYKVLEYKDLTIEQLCSEIQKHFALSDVAVVSESPLIVKVICWND